MAHYLRALENPSHDDEDDVHKENCDDAYAIPVVGLRVVVAVGYGIDHAQGYEHEKVSHLANGHGLGAEAHDAKDGEEAHGSAYVHALALHEAHEQEDTHGHEDEDERIVAAMAAREIEAAGYDSHYDEVDQETQRQGDELLGVEEREAELLTKLIVDLGEVHHGDLLFKYLRFTISEAHGRGGRLAC